MTDAVTSARELYDRDATFRTGISARVAERRCDLKLVDLLLECPFAVLAAVGCRIGEVLALNVEDFDPVRGTPRRRQTYSAPHGHRAPKSENGNRTIRVPRSALAAIRSAIGARKSGPLFASTSGGPRERSTLQRRWRSFLGDLGADYRNVHQLRHSVATVLIAAGMPVADVAKFLGGTVKVVGAKYLHPAGTDPADALEKLLGGRKVGTAATKQRGSLKNQVARLAC
jgi:integrase